MLKNRLEKKSRKLPPAIPLLESQEENSETPTPPNFDKGLLPYIHSVLHTRLVKFKSGGEGGIKNFGVLPVALHRKHPPSMEPKGHVYKTPYFVHETFDVYRFFLLQSAQSRSHHVT